MSIDVIIDEVVQYRMLLRDLASLERVRVTFRDGSYYQFPEVMTMSALRNFLETVRESKYGGV